MFETSTPWPFTPLCENPHIVPLLRCGRPPSPLEYRKLQSLISQLDSCIDHDQDHIWELESQVSFLLERVAILKKNKHILRYLSAPIRKPPPEIMQQIFEFAVDINEFKDDKSISSATRISSVCAQWRSIAQATPRIWSNFLVEVVASDDDQPSNKSTVPFNSNGLIKSLERHLQFSRDADIYLDIRAAYSGPESSLLSSRILDLFAAHALRWRSAKIKAALRETPRLKSLHIHPAPVNSGIPIEIFESCPALTELSLIHYEPKARMPWSQLTSLHFDVSHMTEINTVLDLCPKLLSLSLVVPTSDALDDSVSLVVPETVSIRALTITSRSVFGYKAHSGVQQLCNGLTLPLLHSLTFASPICREYCTPYELRHEIGYWPQSAVENMIVRSACEIQTLCIEGIPLDTDEALRLLRLNPHVVKLSLHECATMHPYELTERRYDKVFKDVHANHFITDDLIKALCVPSSDDADVTLLLPRLRHLEFEVNESFPLVEYVRMIRSRRSDPSAARVPETGVDRLDAVSLTYRTHDSFDCHWSENPESLLKLKQEGLLVRYDDGYEELYEYTDKYPREDSWLRSRFH
ncbi:F-box domain-containing protein [Favolaschia claudopus]|uniref:F-box domain-containing protein n=1 Tax=Favolaschia claudopus TaxID=2862362 RepID=A0AAW0E3F7_9AGAR